MLVDTIRQSGKKKDAARKTQTGLQLGKLPEIIRKDQVAGYFAAGSKSSRGSGKKPKYLREKERLNQQKARIENARKKTRDDKSRRDGIYRAFYTCHYYPMTNQDDTIQSSESTQTSRSRTTGSRRRGHK
ncbi:MAG: hypothetical protein CMF62_00125 [Magnetococcales bacterium]|nr:hypothetical protein [Magnetococcales bacterium]